MFYVCMVSLLGLKSKIYIRVSCRQIQKKFIKEQREETIKRKLDSVISTYTCILTNVYMILEVWCVLVIKNQKFKNVLREKLV